MIKQVHYDQNLINQNLAKTLDIAQQQEEEPAITTPLPNNHKIKKVGRGGARINAGRKKGAIQKLGGADLLVAIERATGKSFADNIAEHYTRAIDSEEWSDVRDYEKFIVSKVISDTKELDITSAGQVLGAVFTFPGIELIDYKNNEEN
jgi:hypothetical protein